MLLKFLKLLHYCCSALRFFHLSMSKKVGWLLQKRAMDSFIIFFKVYKKNGIYQKCEPIKNVQIVKELHKLRVMA